MLSVTLILVAINGKNGSIFADDLAIYIITRSLRVAARALQVVTNKLDAWAAERGKTFSPSKAVSMIFRKRNEEPIEIVLGNKVKLSIESTQFLRMRLDIRLNWDEHINKL